MPRLFQLLSLLVLLTLAAELCSVSAIGPGAVACIVDDDADVELESKTVRESVLQDNWFCGIAGQQIPSYPGKVEVYLAFDETANVEVGPSVRRHRWLCRECC